jgi:hypothetical protein
LLAFPLKLFPMRKQPNTNRASTTDATATGGTSLSYTLAVYLPEADEIQPVANLRTALSMLDDGSRKCDRNLIVKGEHADLWIHMHKDETTLVGLAQCNAELSSPSSYFEVGFESEEQEQLARAIVPALLAEAEALSVAKPLDKASNTGRCIRTKYCPPTNTRGSSLRAWLADDGKPAAKVRVSWNYDLNTSDNHTAAAQAVLAALRADKFYGRYWSDAYDLHGAYIGDGECAFVMRRAEGGAL